MHTPPRVWRLKAGRYRFIGSRCTCGKTYFPKREICVCGKKPKDLQFSGSGIVESYSIIRAAPQGFVAPYVVGIIKTKEGPMVPGQIVGPVEKVKIGAPVTQCFRKIYEVGDAGMLVFGFKFEVE